MKCGTTTFHHDLQQHPAFDVAIKEAGGLRRHDVATPRGRARYLGSSTPDCGTIATEVDTTYAMAPHLPSVAASAAEVVPNARIVYLVRDPVSRVLSHHRHDLASGVVGADLNRVVRDDRRLIDYSRYAYQLRQWLDHFPPESIHVMKFEDYIVNRRGAMDELMGLLGLPPMPASSEFDTRLNEASSRRASRGLLRQILASDAYRHGVRRVLPSSLRVRARDAVIAPTTTRPLAPSRATMRTLVERLSADAAELSEFTGGRVSWDLSRHIRTDAR